MPSVQTSPLAPVFQPRAVEMNSAVLVHASHVVTAESILRRGTSHGRSLFQPLYYPVWGRRASTGCGPTVIELATKEPTELRGKQAAACFLAFFFVRRLRLLGLEEVDSREQLLPAFIKAGPERHVRVHLLETKS